MEIGISPGKRTALKTAVMLMFFFLSAIPLLNANAEIYYALAGGSTREGPELASRRVMLEKARDLNPLDARLPFAEGNIDYARGRTEDAAGHYSRAVALNPLSGECLQMLGIAYDSVGKKEKAKKFMELAILYDPTSAWLRKNYSLWLFSEGEKEAALREMKEAITLDPANTRKYLTSLVLSKVPPHELIDTIPEKPEALFLYGRYCEERGDTEGALESYLEALNVMRRKGDIKTEVYHRIAGIYEREGLLGQAMTYYEEGVQISPSDYGLRFGLAKLYDRLDIPYRAKEEYEKVLILNPLNEYAQKRLRELRGR
jgi:tetratricopeptide (TPR) repeat protein